MYSYIHKTVIRWYNSSLQREDAQFVFNLRYVIRDKNIRIYLHICLESNRSKLSLNWLSNYKHYKQLVKKHTRDSNMVCNENKATYALTARTKIAMYSFGKLLCSEQTSSYEFRTTHDKIITLSTKHSIACL